MLHQKNGSPPEGFSKDDVIWHGLDLLDEHFRGRGNEDRSTQAYEDLCLGLDLMQVKQVNELLHQLLAVGE